MNLYFVERIIWWFLQQHNDSKSRGVGTLFLFENNNTYETSHSELVSQTNRGYARTLRNTERCITWLVKELEEKSDKIYVHYSSCSHDSLVQ